MIVIRCIDTSFQVSDICEVRGNNKTTTAKNNEHSRLCHHHYPIVRGFGLRLGTGRFISGRTAATIFISWWCWCCWLGFIAIVCSCRCGFSLASLKNWRTRQENNFLFRNNGTVYWSEIVVNENSSVIITIKNRMNAIPESIRRSMNNWNSYKCILSVKNVVCLSFNDKMMTTHWNEQSRCK